LRSLNAGVSLLSAPPPGTGATNTNPPPPANTALSLGQILDVHQAMNAILRHRTTISTELDELKRSSLLLWEEAQTPHAKHQKQQDTINRIIKFLAGVVDHHAGASAGGVSLASPGVSEEHNGMDEDVNSLGEAEGTRQRIRLMIEDAKRGGWQSTIEKFLPCRTLKADPRTPQDCYCN